MQKGRGRYRAPSAFAGYKLTGYELAGYDWLAAAGSTAAILALVAGTVRGHEHAAFRASGRTVVKDAGASDLGREGFFP